MPSQLTPAVANAILSAQDLNDNWDLIEASLLDQGTYVISGLVPSAGTGLAVNVTAGTALIGMRVTKAAGFTISGLSPSTTNHLYLLRDGTATHNTSGTQPAESVKLGTATTDGSGVTAVATNHASGRQALVRLENMVHGGGAGHARPVDLADWNATQQEGSEVFGVLPAGALPGGGGNVAVTTKTANYTATTADYVILVDATGGAVTITLPTAVGNTGKVFVVKRLDASGNTVDVDGNGSQTIDGALTLNIAVQWASYNLISDGTNFLIW